MHARNSNDSIHHFHRDEVLGGLLVCGRCGRRLLAAYSGKANRLRYTCMQATMSYGAPGCLSLAGTVLDNFVAEQVLQVLAPASLELSLAAEQALRAERAHLEGHWQQRLERARYAVERAVSVNIAAQGGDPALLNLDA